MAQFEAFAPDVETNGAAVSSMVEAMGEFKQMALNILEEHGIVAPEEGTWHSQQAWLDAFKEIAEAMGSVTVKMIGKEIPEVVQWPPDIDTVEKSLASIDVAYHMNHRGGDIGHYAFEKTGEQSCKMVCDNPYPCDFDMGIIEATARKFSSEGVHLGIRHETSEQCRKKGDDVCTYLISW
ncbi:MAG: hypothetical protein HQ515_12505 [Phycisphaeraceae bacterium]|nr:hypothetical protein [Phycisphaeraceae bacterium]